MKPYIVSQLLYGFSFLILHNGGAGGGGGVGRDAHFETGTFTNVKILYIIQGKVNTVFK